MTIALTATQRSDTRVDLAWTSTDPDPAAGFQITRETNPPDTPKTIATVNGESTQYVDAVTATAGDVLEYTVEDLDTTETGTVTIALVDLDAPFTYTPVDSGLAVPRYTTLEKVKAVLAISSSAKDDRITQSIVAVELAMDMELGHRFPSTGDNPRWPYVPVPIAELAMDGAVAAFTASNSPHGTAGSDEWMGTISIADSVSKSVRRNPLLRGYQISFGFA